MKIEKNLSFDLLSKNFPVLLAMVSASSFVLAIIYNFVLFSFIDFRILTFLSLSDYLIATIPFFPVVVLTSFFQVSVSYYFLKSVPKRELDKKFRYFREPSVIGMLFGAVLTMLFLVMKFPYLGNEKFIIIAGIVIISLFAILSNGLFLLYKYNKIKIDFIRLKALQFVCFMIMGTILVALINVKIFFYERKYESNIIIDNVTREIELVRILQGGLIFLEGDKLIYRRNGEEVVLKNFNNSVNNIITPSAPISGD